MFSKILIANRGEIACRIIQSAHRLGVKCVAVYSEADLNARHVAMADEAFLLGPAPSSESYLRSDRIIEICHLSGTEAVHPGYGFLSENEEFARALEAEKIVFIGPPASAIAAMGSKSAAKNIMSEAGVPLVPGYHGAGQSTAALMEEAKLCGFPLLLKAVAGGGGKGMRVVASPDEFEQALESARREAEKAFGNPDMLLERYLTQPRHVEIQVFCDQHGNGIYLAERDCSVQRRHQKVIEEAPAPGLDKATRQAMGEAAVRAAQAIDYVGAGTVEFLYDIDGSFYFMEMNTRLQVEHPVTEMITGQDLVVWQLQVAAGAELPLKQEMVEVRGHALEARIYAEDPANDFLPATGRLEYLRTPAQSMHVRVDTGVIEGDAVTVYYDPMIAKLIVWDDTREAAINRMVQALDDYRIAGLKTNTWLLRRVVDSSSFRNQELDTGFIEKHHDLLFSIQNLDVQFYLVLSAVCFLVNEKADATVPDDCYSPFSAQSSWRLNSEYARPMKLLTDGELHELHILERLGEYEIILDDATYRVSAELHLDALHIVINGHRLTIHYYQKDDELVLFYEGEQFNCSLHRDSFGETDHDGGASLTAPMNGTIVAVLVKKGNRVLTGEPLVIMEAMKMEHSICAPYDGTVADIHFQEGDMVSEGAELIAIEVKDGVAA
ncbi:MAG: acetyl/propionyl/methylcrotonyl-CoA carboxylase subunit alpha [Candidatus Thiodiazotropha sp.]